MCKKQNYGMAINNGLCFLDHQSNELNENYIEFKLYDVIIFNIINTYNNFI